MNRPTNRFENGKPIFVTDFCEGPGFCVELARTGKSSSLALVRHMYGSRPESVMSVTTSDSVLVPLKEDEITDHVRFAETVGEKKLPARTLIKKIDSFFDSCLDLDERHRFLLACFVLSTWVVDRLPVAPYIALVGMPQSGKSTALAALSLVCRRGLITYDISSAALHRACDRLMPTLCIDETGTAAQKRTLFHLLRSGTSRNAAAFRQGESYRAYGAKAFAWSEVPDDEALNSRCVTIPMQESSRRDLWRTTDHVLMGWAAQLQGKLLRYRLDHCCNLVLAKVPGEERLRSRQRDLYEALALPLDRDPELCACLLECFEDQLDHGKEPLPPKQIAVLESFFKQIHSLPNQESYALRQLKDEVNRWLAAAGEHFRLNERVVSETLRPFGFVNRKRTMSGWVVLVDRAARKRLHDLLWLHGLNSLPNCHPIQSPSEQCEFCNNQNRSETSEHHAPAAPATGEFFRSGAWAHADEEELEETRRDRYETDEAARRTLTEGLIEQWQEQKSQDAEHTGPVAPADNDPGEPATAVTTPLPASGSNGHEHDEHYELEIDVGKKNASAPQAPSGPRELGNDKEEVLSPQGVENDIPVETGRATDSSPNRREGRDLNRDAWTDVLTPSHTSWWPREPGDDGLAKQVIQTIKEHELEEHRREEPDYLFHDNGQKKDKSKVRRQSPRKKARNRKRSEGKPDEPNRPQS